MNDDFSTFDDIYCPEAVCAVKNTITCCKYCYELETCTWADKCNQETTSYCHSECSFENAFSSNKLEVPYDNLSFVVESEVDLLIGECPDLYDPQQILKTASRYFHSVLMVQPGLESISMNEAGDKLSCNGILFAEWNSYCFPAGNELIPETSGKDFDHFIHEAIANTPSLVVYRSNNALFVLYLFLETCLHIYNCIPVVYLNGEKDAS